MVQVCRRGTIHLRLGAFGLLLAMGCPDAILSVGAVISEFGCEQTYCGSGSGGAGVTGAGILNSAVPVTQ